MLVHISPTYSDFGDTLCSFNFASRILDDKSGFGFKVCGSPFEFMWRRFRKMREERKKYPFDLDFRPSEQPQDLLGYTYNGVVTAVSQTVFRELEFLSRRSPRFIAGCNTVASVVQNTAAKLAYSLIGEESAYSTRKVYKCVAGIYALSRFLVPVLIGIGAHEHSKRAKATLEKEKHERQESAARLVKKLQMDTHLVIKRVDRIEESVEDLKLKMQFPSLLTKRGGQGQSLDVETSRKICEAISAA